MYVFSLINLMLSIMVVFGKATTNDSDEALRSKYVVFRQSNVSRDLPLALNREIFARLVYNGHPIKRILPKDEAQSVLPPLVRVSWSSKYSTTYEYVYKTVAESESAETEAEAPESAAEGDAPQRYFLPINVYLPLPRIEEFQDSTVHIRLQLPQRGGCEPELYFKHEGTIVTLDGPVPSAMADISGELELFYQPERIEQEHHARTMLLLPHPACEDTFIEYIGISED